MKMALRLTALSGVLVAFTGAAFAQTADEIVERQLTALGGRAALGSLTSRSLAGTITLSTPGGDVTGSVEIFNMRPNKSRTVIKLDLSAFNLGQMVVDQRFDGSTGFVIDTLQGNREITGDMLEAMKNAGFPTMMLDYKERGGTVELAGKEKVGERDAFVIVVKPATGPSTQQYVDAESYLPLKQVVRGVVPGIGEVQQVTEFLAYSRVDGYAIPTQVRNTSAVQTSTVSLTQVEHNQTLDEAMFSKPAEK